MASDRVPGRLYPRVVEHTDPSEVILLTGYHGPGHWEETRVTQPKPEGVDSALWQGDLELRKRREQITLKTWVNLMQAVEIAPHG